MKTTTHLADGDGPPPPDANAVAPVAQPFPPNVAFDRARAVAF